MVASLASATETANPGLLGALPASVSQCTTRMQTSYLHALDACSFMHPKSWLCLQTLQCRADVGLLTLGAIVQRLVQSVRLTSAYSYD